MTQPADRPVVVVSACLLGQRTRYDGRVKRCGFVADVLVHRAECVAVCPEVDCGLSVPRPPMQLYDEPGGLRLREIDDGKDHTDRLTGWCDRRLEELAELDVRGCVFKSRSPSCGLTRVPRCAGDGARVGEGMGLFARAFVERFGDVPAIEDDLVDSWEPSELVRLLTGGGPT